MAQILLTLLDYSPKEIRGLISLALELKASRLVRYPSSMANKTGVLIFEKPSLRTRVSFEVAIHELGGHPINLAANMVGMGIRETVGDVGRNLERWVHLIVARTYAHSTVEELARHTGVPVINALTDKFHPCQALAFGVTMRERLGDRPYRVAFVGDGNNVCHSLMALCAKLGCDFTLACPKGYEPDRAILERCREAGKQNGATIEVVNDVEQAVDSAHVIYTDVWTSMGQESERERRTQDFSGYQVNEDLLKRANPSVVVSHCLPAHRGDEITSSVLDAPSCAAFDEAENRLHAQKAVIHYLFTQPK